MITSKRMTIVDSIDYKADLEYNDSYVVLHLPRVDKFNKTVLQDMRVKVDELYDFFDTVGYEGLWSATEVGDTKTARLLSMLNFEGPIGTSEGYDVYQYKAEEVKDVM